MELTPCQRKCKVEEGSCTTCMRTLQEIKEWKSMANEDRMLVMKELKWRGSTHSCPKCEGPAYCAMEDGKSGSTCWCMTVDKPYVPETSYEQCMCKTCLTKS